MSDPLEPLTTSAAPPAGDPPVTAADPPGDASTGYASPGAYRRPGRFRRLGPAGLMAAATLVVPPVGAFFLAVHAKEWVGPARQSPWGPAIVAAVFAVAGGFALVPTAALSIIAGWAFGFARGLPTAVAGFAGAAAVCYAVVRRTAGDGVIEAVEADPRWRAVHQAILGGSWARTLWIVALLRLPVVPPFGATSVALAALRVRPGPFLLGTALGVVPRTTGYVLLASRMGELDFAAADDWLMLAAWAAVTVAVIGAITVLGRRALRNLTAEVA